MWRWLEHDMRSPSGRPLQKRRPPLSKNALQIIGARYLAEGDQTWEDIADRVATKLSSYEGDNRDLYKAAFRRVIHEGEFVPAGRTLRNCGASSATVPNCIVLDIEDSMDGIFRTLHRSALLQQAGSGLGFAFDSLRPAGEPVTVSNSSSSGPTSFIRIYDAAFSCIKQQNRHGATMAMCSVDHPDVLDFIYCKEKEGTVSNFNISVKFTDQFMQQAVDRSPTPWRCKWNGREYPLRTIKRDSKDHVTGIKEHPEVTASQLLDVVAECGWRNGEPGYCFIDTVNRHNPLPGLGELQSTNPCGEQALHPDDICCLGSLNLEAFVRWDGAKWLFNFKRLGEVVWLAVRMLDDVVEDYAIPDQRIQSTVHKNRRIGLGVMGLSHTLFLLGLPYNGKKGLEMGERIARHIQTEAREASRLLAEEKGAFPNLHLSIYQQHPQRNCNLTTVAPTGTISAAMDTSGGIEPVFALAFHYRGVLGRGDDPSLVYRCNPILEDALMVHFAGDDEEVGRVVMEVAKTGSLQHVDGVPPYLKRVFVTAQDISPEDHLKMQAVWQRWVDNSISKTINLPNHATRADVRKVIEQAWRMGCKGCTVYRDGSRQLQVLNVGVQGGRKKRTATERRIVKRLKRASEEEPVLCVPCQVEMIHQEGCLACPQCHTSLCSR